MLAELGVSGRNEGGRPPGGTSGEVDAPWGAQAPHLLRGGLVERAGERGNIGNVRGVRLLEDAVGRLLQRRWGTRSFGRTGRKREISQYCSHVWEGQNNA